MGDGPCKPHAQSIGETLGKCDVKDPQEKKKIKCHFLK